MIKKGNNKSIAIYIISALFPALFCCIIWAIIGIYPGSSRTLLSTDLFYEYYGAYEYLKTIVSGHNSLFYNWSLYMGYNMIGLYSFDVSSPWAWLTLLWSADNFPTAIYVISLIKIALSGLTFSIFLVKRPVHSYIFAKSEIVDGIGIIAFSTCYALMNYSMKYLINNMWIDSVYMLPLVMLGIERIVAYRKSLLFYISATLMLFFNFYTACMVAIFSIFYFTFYCSYLKSYLANDEENKYEIVFSRKAILTYIYSGLCAVGTSMVLLLPTYYCINQGKLDDYTNDATGFTTLPIWNIIQSFFYGNYDTITNESRPPVFCTSFCIIFAILFLVVGLKKRAKIIPVIISVFWILTLWIAPLNRIWTGFRDPVCFPYRYAFVISAFFIVLGFEGFILFFNSKFKYKKPIWLLYGILTVCELFLCVNNARVGMIKEVGDQKKSAIDYAFDKYSRLVDLAKKAEDTDINSSGFYRFEKDEHYTMNDGMVFSYDGIQSFCSVFSQSQLDYLDRIGLKQDDYESYEDGRTVITDSLIGIKYLASYKASIELYNNIGESRQMKLYSNPYALSLGYMVDGAAGMIEWSDSPYENQNSIINSMLGEEASPYISVDFDEQIISYDDVDALINKDASKAIRSTLEGGENRLIKVTADYDGHYYLYAHFDYDNKPKDDINSIYNEYKQVYVNGTLKEVFSLGGYSYNIDLGSYHKGDEINLIVTNCSAGTENFVSYLDNDKVIYSLEKLANGPQLKDISIEKGNMTAGIEVTEDGLLFMSIPYDKGWTLWIDGEKTEIIEVFNTFSACEISKGNHTVVMKYVSPLFVEGLIISIIAIVAYFSAQIYVSCRKKS